MTERQPGAVGRLMLLSIRPEHVDNILTGAKTVELRRVRPQVETGQPVAVYATTPVAAIVATCRVHRVDYANPETIKQSLLHRTGVSSEFFDSYFEGSSHAAAIHMTAVRPLEHVVTLSHLRRRQRSYNPPQTWHFLDRAKLRDLIGHHISHRELSTLLTCSP